MKRVTTDQMKSLATHGDPVSVRHALLQAANDIEDLKTALAYYGRGEHVREDYLTDDNGEERCEIMGVEDGERAREAIAKLERQ